MSVAFGAAAAGLVIGMFYDLYLVAIRHAQLENVLGHSISYNKILGALGTSGMMFFLLSCSPRSLTRNRTDPAK